MNDILDGFAACNRNAASHSTARPAKCAKPVLSIAKIRFLRRGNRSSVTFNRSGDVA